MPQLDTTYFVSQFFWLSILFTLFYLAIRFLIIPKLHSIIHARSIIKEESDSFVGIVDIEIAQLKIESKKKSDDLSALIKHLEEEANSKYDVYSKDLLSKLQTKLEKSLDISTKEIEDLKKKTLAESKMNELAIQSAKNMIFKLTNLDISDTELKNFIK